nr:neprilysin-1-like [Rhipicephalus microplus]
MLSNQEGLVNRTSSTVARSTAVNREDEQPQGAFGGARARSPQMVRRDLFRMLGPTRSCMLLTILVIAGLCTAGLVVYVTQRVIYARIQEHQRVRQYLREVLGETGPDSHPGAPFPRQPFIFACRTEHCTKEGKHLRRNVAWSLDPCRDFHEYACSGDARRPSLREDALSHFLAEVRSVLGKWGQYRWTRRPPVHIKASRFFRACDGSKHSRETMEHDLAQYLRGVDRNHRLPEAWAAEVARTLQFFPVFEVSVAEVSDASCIVLKEPERFDGDAVLGMPTIASRTHRQLIAKMMKGEAKSLDDALQFAWSLRSFGGPPDDTLTPMSNISQTTITALAAEFKGEWRWERFLEAFLLGHLDMSDQTCVIVRSPSYMKHVAEVMAEVKAETVRAYFSYSLHLHLWPFWRLLDGDKEQHEQACAMLTYRLFNFGFVKHFNDTARMSVVAKAGLKEAVVRNSYRMAMLQSGDIPKDVREQVLDGIANADKSYFNPMDDVDAYYAPTQSVSVNWRHILTTYLEIRHSLVSHWLKYVVGSGGRVFDTNLDLACRFNPDTKTLGIPMSIADVDVGGREFFLDIPTVGLLMTRSLYRIFQERAMWSSELRKLRVCLQRAYSNITVSEGQSVDGLRCLRTSIMDHVVLRAVHKAFKTAVVTYSPQKERGYQMRDVSLHFPEVPNVSSEQLFFLMYAQSFCEPHEDVADVLQRASWAPIKFRLNRQLADFGSFSDAFRCAPGTPMHPKQRCTA